MKWIILALISFTSLTHAQQVDAHSIQSNIEQPRLMLYYSPTCPYSKDVLNYLDSINKTIPMKNVYASEEIKKELIQKGGKKQVPCLLINDKPLYESQAIIEWLSAHKEGLESNRGIY